MPVFSSRTSFWLAGAVVALALWCSACPTMTYPLYQSEWGVSTTTVAWIFAAYPIALIPVLIVLGDLSDHIGRRRSMIWGMLAELLGVLCFVVAGDVAWLLVGRALMGLGVGLSLSAASVAMVEFSRPGQEGRASALATGVSALGIALAMTVGGALTEYAPQPMRLHFVVLALSIVTVTILVLGIPAHTRDEAAEPWRVRSIVIPQGRRGIFVAGAIAFTSAFLLGAIVLPLGARIAQQLAGSTNSLVTGALLSVFAVCITLTSLCARRFNEWSLVTLGAIGSIAAVWLYVVTGASHSMVIFFIASACAGAAYAFNFAGGLTVLSKYAAPHHRASMVSGGYLVGYLSQGIGAPLLGWVVTVRGLRDGLLGGAIVFTAFFVAVIVGAVLARRSVAREEATTTLGNVRADVTPSRR
ncbi:MFS transporter [Nocardioides sp. LHG3406-4]|uniref:MFS transporter n=1 Tax=Nocardioides sp. LHG3406-4 TaxID=2804575 RepID=UPI003CF1618B